MPIGSDIQLLSALGCRTVGRRWDEALDDDGQTTSDDSEGALLDELRSLAAKVQDQLGPTFSVEIRLPGS